MTVLLPLQLGLTVGSMPNQAIAEIEEQTMRIVLNERVLANGPLTGVQRYVQEIGGRLRGHVDRVTPEHAVEGVAGHLWEQFALPIATRGQLLFSPSNTGPIAKAKQVVTVHDVVPLDHPEWLDSRFAMWYRFVVPRVSRRAKRVIAVSEFTRQRIIDTIRLAPEKVITIHNGVDARFFARPTAPEVAAVKHDLGLHARYVLSLGSVEPRKNLPRLLKAWSKVLPELPQDLELVLAGGRGKDLVFANSDITQRPPRVKFLGHVPDPLLPALIHGAEAFAYVSLYEGFGLPPLEAMAVGVPVLTSGTTALNEVAADSALCVDPTSVDSIATALKRLVTDAGLRATLSSLGPLRAAGFTWDRAAKLTLQVLLDASHQ